MKKSTIIGIIGVFITLLYIVYSYTYPIIKTNQLINNYEFVQDESDYLNTSSKTMNNGLVYYVSYNKFPREVSVSVSDLNNPDPSYLSLFYNKAWGRVKYSVFKEGPPFCEVDIKSFEIIDDDSSCLGYDESIELEKKRLNEMYDGLKEIDL